MEELFTDQLRHEWEVYSADTVDPLTTDEIMEFLKRRMANLSISNKCYSSYSSSSHHKHFPSTVKSRFMFSELRRRKMSPVLFVREMCVVLGNILCSNPGTSKNATIT